jgi:hypothetical protein
MANKERVALLVATLRSGKYLQGRAVLESIAFAERRNCCLGVACRVAMDNGCKVTVVDDPGNLWVQFDESRGRLPESVIQWYGFGNGGDNPILDLGEGKGWLPAISCNDSLRMPFPEIADAFERTFMKEDEDA